MSWSRSSAPPLFIRSRAGATLTAAGEALLGPARQALRDVEHAAAAVAAVTGLVAGHLDLACLPTLAADPVAELVGRFRREHPGRGRADGGAARPRGAGRRGAHRRRGGGHHRAGRQPTRASRRSRSASRSSSPSPPPAGRRAPLRLERLDGVPLVLSPTGSSLRDAVDLALADAGVRPDIGVETAQRDALIPLVLAGAGTTFLPDTLARAAGRLGATVRPTRPACAARSPSSTAPATPAPPPRGSSSSPRPEQASSVTSRAETGCGSVTPLRAHWAHGCSGAPLARAVAHAAVPGPVPPPHHLHRHQLDRLQRRDGRRPAHRQGGHRRPGGRRRPRRDPPLVPARRGHRAGRGVPRLRATGPAHRAVHRPRDEPPRRPLRPAAAPRRGLPRPLAVGPAPVARDDRPQRDAALHRLRRHLLRADPRAGRRHLRHPRVPPRAARAAHLRRRRSRCWCCATGSSGSTW